MEEKADIKVIEDEDGKKIVVIPFILFSGKQHIKWDEVEKYLKRYVGKMIEIAEGKDVIHIRSDFPDEYTHSEYTRKLRGGLAKAKANLVQGIDELLKIATDKRWKENLKEKHKGKAEKGWYRYNSRFALPVMNVQGDIIAYNIYCAVLIIRHASDKRLYLYDIQNIKKETSKPP